MTSSPVSGSRKKLPEMPVIPGGTPVTIQLLFTFVNDGSAPRAWPRNPSFDNWSMFGITPCAEAALRYASSDPSRQITTIGRSEAA